MISRNPTRAMAPSRRDRWVSIRNGRPWPKAFRRRSPEGCTTTIEWAIDLIDQIVRAYAVHEQEIIVRSVSSHVEANRFVHEHRSAIERLERNHGFRTAKAQVAAMDERQPQLFCCVRS